MRFNITDIAVCVDCLHLTANGEINDGTDAARDCVRGQRDKWGDDARYFTCGGEELGYSTSDCEGCGNPYHGDRFQAHVMVPLTKIRTGNGDRMYVSSEDGSYTEVYVRTELYSVIERNHRGERKVYRATRTWADGFGRWHASVPTSGHPLRDANRARRMIITELAQREGSTFDPRTVHVTRDHFRFNDAAVVYSER